MGKLLHGKFELKINSLRNGGYGETDRYNAVIVSTGEDVSVKFLNHGKDPAIFVGKTAIFDGDDNDIQTDPKEQINLSRPKKGFYNPLIKKLLE